MRSRFAVVLGVCLAVGLASNAGARTITYQLHGSTLEDCTIGPFVQPPHFRSCTPSERREHAPTEGHTLDGTIKINESKIASGTLSNISMTWFSEDSTLDVNIANDDPFGIDLSVGGFMLTTDNYRRPVSWVFNSDLTGGGLPLGQFFSGPKSAAPEIPWIAFLGLPASRHPEEERAAVWTGRGGTLSLIPLPPTLPLALSALAALGLIGRFRRRPRRGRVVYTTYTQLEYQTISAI